MIRTASHGCVGCMFAMFFLIGTFLGASNCVNGQSLHERIDSLIPKTESPLQASLVSDSLFLRRLSLDLRYAAPTSEELVAFQADTDPNKRSKWVDQVLADPLFAERMVTWLDLTLMERRAAQQVQRQAWLDWLRSKVDQSTPLDQLAREILDAPWWDKNARPQQRFFLDRGGDPHLITRDVGRIFLGRDMQCAQCHDHPLVEDYRQRDYHGLLAFFSQSASTEVTTKDAEGKDQKLMIYLEKAGSDAPFESVFDKGKPHWMGPALPLVAGQWEPFVPPTARYAAAALDWVTSPTVKRPNTSRRQQIAAQLTDPAYRPFVENWANRLWASMLGKGIVHPLDMHHAHNPPTDEKLLKTLADGLIELKFDAKAFLREIALCQAYQRSNELPMEQDSTSLMAIDVSPVQSTLASLEAELTGLVASSDSTKTIFRAASDALTAVEAEHVKLRSDLAKQEAAWNDAHKKVNDLTVARDKAAKPLTDTRTKQALLAEAVAKLEQAKALAGEDAELAAAIATAVARRDAAATQIPPLETALQAAQAPLDAAIALEKTTQEQLLAAGNTLETIKAQVLEKTLELQRSRGDWQRASSRLVQVRKSISNASKLIAWRAAQTELQDRSVQLAGLETQRLAVINRLQEVRGQVEQAEKNQLEKESQKGAMVQQLTSLQSNQNAVSKEVEQLQQTSQQLASTSSLLANPQSLEPTSNEIQLAIQSRQKKASELQSQADQSLLELKAIDEQIASFTTQKQALRDAMVVVEQEQVKAEQAVADAHAAIQSAKARARELEDSMRETSEDEVRVARLRPLSSEQLCWSILRVMGILDQSIGNETVELDKQSPLPAEPPPTEAILRDRKWIATRRAIDKLRGNADVFASLYAGVSGQPDNFFASAEQALFVMNGGSVYAWAGPANNNIASKVAQAADPKMAAELLYEALLCRKPSAEESAALVAYLSVGPELRNARTQEATWAILSGAEFRFQQ